MKKFFISLTFLLLTVTLVAHQSKAQSFRPLSFLKYSVQFISFNEQSVENNALDQDGIDNDEKKIKDAEPINEAAVKTKTNPKPASSRITIDLGKALFEKYIK